MIMPDSQRARSHALPTCIFAAAIGLLVCLAGIKSSAAELTNSVAATDAVRLEKTFYPDEQKVFAQYGGSESCKDCHAEEYDLWKKSNHGLAERLVQPGRDRAD